MNNTNINDIHYKKLIMFLLLLIKKYFENYFPMQKQIHDIMHYNSYFFIIY